MADANEILDAINSAAATSWQDVLSAINTYSADLLEGESATHFSELPAGQGRQQAIAQGLQGQIALYGQFTSLADLQAAVNNQVVVEYEKYLFINAIDDAKSEADIVAALMSHVEILNDHRQDLIASLKADLSNTAAQSAAAQLEASTYTKILKEVADRLSDGDFVSDVAAGLMAARAETQDGRFYGIVAITDAMNAAADASDATLLEAFNNDGADWTAILQAINDNDSTLLDAAHATKMGELPNGQGREKAIALGVLEIRNLLGDFATVDDVKEAVTRQIDVEYAKHLFIGAIDNAGDVDAMVLAIKNYVDQLSDDRQALITEWDGIEGNAALDARVEELKNDPYTIVLKQVADRLGNPAFIADLAAKLLVARDEMEGDKFFGVVKIVDAMDDAMDITAPVAPMVVLTTDSGTVGDGITNVGDLTVTSEDGATVEYSLDGATWSTTAPTATDLTEGANTVFVRQTDTAGNVSGETRFTFTLDTAGPTIEFIVLGDTALKAGETTTVTIAFSEAVTGFDGSDVTAENGTLGEFTSADGKTWTATFTPTADIEDDANAIAVAGSYTDVAGNAGIGASSGNYEIDTTAPAAGALAFTGLDDTGANTADGLTNDTTFDLTLTGTEAGTTVVYQVSKDGGEWTDTTASQADLADGSYQFRAVVTDAAGNSSTTETISVTIDATAPAAAEIAISGGDDILNKDEATAAVAVSIAPDEGATVVSAKIGDTDLTVTDDGYSFDATGLEDGQYTITVVTKDNAGNETTTTKTLTIDKTAPEAPTPTKEGQGFSVEAGAEVSVTVDGVVQTDLSERFTKKTVNGRDIYTAKADAFTGSEDIDISATLTDQAGNVSEAGTLDDQSFDTTGPSVSIALDKPALKAGETAIVTITFSEKVTGFDGSDVMVENGTLSNFDMSDDGKTWTATFTPNADVEDATNVVTVTGNYTDEAGNAGIDGESGSFGIDTKAPTVTVDMAALADGTSTVTITFSEVPTGFDVTDLGLVGGTLGELTPDETGKVFTATFTPAANFEGDASVTVTAGSYTDAAGNVGTSGTDSLAVDTKSPASATIHVAGEENGLNGTEATDTVAVTIDAGTGAQVVSAKIGVSDLAVTDDGYSFDATGLEDGEYTITVVTKDNAGNETTTTKKIVIDTAAPAITTAATQTIAENQSVVAALAASEAVTFSISGGADKDLFAIVDGQLVFKTAPDYEAGKHTYDVEVSARDAAGNIRTQTITVNLTNVNEAPTNISLSNASVQELTAIGKEVGTLSATDQDAGESFTYTLLDNAGGRFAIKDGKVVVADNVKLDYEQATSHQVKVQVTDKSGATFEKVLTINVTNLTNETVTGTSSADVLKGDTGRDSFVGGSGNDTLWGGLGNDTLKGEGGKDAFVFDTKPNKSTNKDKIVDFSVKDDSIWLDNAVFTKLGKAGSADKPAQLNKAFFTIGTKAKDKNDYLVYDNKKGVLYYDADGSGHGKAIEIATLSKNLKMTYKDFFVI